MAPAQHDLLIIASARADFFDVLQHFPDSVSIEVRLNRRRGQRRRTREPSTSDERRRRDRRAIDVSEELRVVGWVFIPAAERNA
jgi:hypothetical protein